MRLKDKTALITGAAAGIGRCAAELFADEGCRVLAVDRNAEGLQELAADLKSAGPSCRTLEADLSSAQDCRRCVEAAQQWTGGLDVLFNNAGVV
ncbi:MAG TPA: SDR family NAD(P)-dependent oxidoreductase, partial [Acidobacteriota bacterium]|nr:SDR family NAD(P)-dependent oxidoreductase [Acidobacteriota bacterium]